MLYFRTTAFNCGNRQQCFSCLWKCQSSTVERLRCIITVCTNDGSKCGI